MNNLHRDTKKVAILITGDEIINGEIADSNGHHIAQQLFAHNIDNGLRLSCDDDQTRLEYAIQFLLQHHQALITIGGLGPTSDDRTRFALAKVLNQELVFDPDSWQRLVDRLTAKQIAVAETNRQQALFPQDAKIIPNINGSAAACAIQHQQQTVFMLPGPPNECLPIFEEVVLPQLLAQGFAKTQYRQRWTLTGIGESTIAQQLDPLLADYNFTLGYRFYRPYLDIKITTMDQQIFDTVKALVEDKVKDYLV